MPKNLNSVPRKQSTWDMYSPQMVLNHSKKVQAIFALTPPTGMKDLHRFLGIVQYYRDFRAKRSDMLAPLTSSVGECGHTKVTKALKTKKVPWHWDEVHQNAFNDIKAIITRDVALAYPDYSRNLRFTLMPHQDRWV